MWHVGRSLYQRQDVVDGLGSAWRGWVWPIGNLKSERGLDLKDPEAQPLSTWGSLPYLGYRIRPDGIFLGTKARGRLPRHIRLKNSHIERIQTVVRSFKTIWMFGN